MHSKSQDIDLDENRVTDKFNLETIPLISQSVTCREEREIQGSNCILHV